MVRDAGHAAPVTWDAAISITAYIGMSAMVAGRKDYRVWPSTAQDNVRADFAGEFNRGDQRSTTRIAADSAWRSTTIRKRHADSRLTAGRPSVWLASCRSRAGHARLLANYVKQPVRLYVNAPQTITPRGWHSVELQKQTVWPGSDNPLVPTRSAISSYGTTVTHTVNGMQTLKLVFY